MKITLQNGIELDTEGFAAPFLQAEAIDKGLSDMRVFLATHPDGQQTYLVAIGQEPVYESTSPEAVSAFIGRAYLDRAIT